MPVGVVLDAEKPAALAELEEVGETGESDMAEEEGGVLGEGVPFFTAVGLVSETAVLLFFFGAIFVLQMHSLLVDGVDRFYVPKFRKVRVTNTEKW